MNPLGDAPGVGLADEGVGVGESACPHDWSIGGVGEQMGYGRRDRDGVVAVDIDLGQAEQVGTGDERGQAADMSHDRVAPGGKHLAAERGLSVHGEQVGDGGEVASVQGDCIAGQLVGDAFVVRRRNGYILSIDTEDARLSSLARLLRPSALRELFSTPGAKPRLSLAGGLPPDEAMPFDTIGDVVAELMSRGDGSALQYTSAEGDLRLREAIAAWISPDLGRVIDPTAIVVTAGTQQTLDLISRVLLDPGDDVVVESPTYVGALRVIVPTGARVSEVPVDDDGLDTAVLAGKLHEGLRPKFVYVVSNFSNPSAATLSPDRRLHLAELADTYGFVVVEDDQYGRLRFAGDHIPPIASHGDAVVYVSGFSKVIAPGLRVGFCVLPDWLHRPVVLAKQATDLASPSLGQRIATELLARPEWFATHLDHLRSLYRARASALLRGTMPIADRIEVRRPEGGMFTWARLATGEVDAAELARRCLERGLVIMPGREFSLTDRFPRELRLSFSTSSPAELEEAATLLAQALG